MSRTKKEVKKVDSVEIRKVAGHYIVAVDYENYSEETVLISKSLKVAMFEVKNILMKIK